MTRQEHILLTKNNFTIVFRCLHPLPGDQLREQGGCYHLAPGHLGEGAASQINCLFHSSAELAIAKGLFWNIQTWFTENATLAIADSIQFKPGGITIITFQTNNSNHVGQNALISLTFEILKEGWTNIWRKFVDIYFRKMTTSMVKLFYGF